MKKKSEIINCRGIKKVNGRLFFKDESLIMDGLILGEADIYSNIQSYNGLTYYYSNSEYFLINRETGKSISIFKGEGYDYIEKLNSYYLCHKRISRQELTYSLLNNNGDIIWEETGDKFIGVLVDKLLQTKRLLLDEFWIKESSNTLLYHFVLPQGFSISHKILVSGEVLFFLCNKQRNTFKKAIGLNLHTGEKLWELDYKAPYNENLIAYLQNTENNLCYGLGREYYQVFDPKTGTVLLQKDISSFFSKGMAPDLSRQSIYDGRLWFVSGRGSDVRFGALDISAGEIEFVQDYPLEGDDQFDTPVFHEGRLYLRGIHSNKLYIFETS